MIQIPDKAMLESFQVMGTTMSKGRSGDHKSEQSSVPMIGHPLHPVDVRANPGNSVADAE